MAESAEVVAYIGLGSNVGDRAGNISRAIEAIGSSARVRVISSSNLYQTSPVGPADQPDFINAAIAVRTTLSARRLLWLLQSIESKMGRVRTRRWGPRIIDLDILLYADDVVAEPGLTIPHPRMHLRWFALAPLAQIAPSARHPLLDATVAELLTCLESRGSVQGAACPLGPV